VSDDFGGRAREETLLLEIFPLLAELRHARSRPQRWMRPRRVRPVWYLLPAGRAHRVPAARRGGRDRRVELPALPLAVAARRRARRRQPRDGEAERGHAAHRRRDRAAARRALPARVRGRG
jgi:hypothetical protein